jgi:NADPH:quinone reductase-like Zn-dependent oxidoreductase
VGNRELPEPGARQVRVRAAGVNPVDGKIRSGAAQQMFPTQLPAVLGIEIAGTVDGVGLGSDGLAVGGAVLGFADGGGYAKYALATTMAPKPAGPDWAAAALPVAAETALRVLGLFEVAWGDTVLIHGAAGALGTVAVQIAVARAPPSSARPASRTTTTCASSVRRSCCMAAVWSTGSEPLRRKGSAPCSTSPVRERCRTPSSCAAERPAS